MATLLSMKGYVGALRPGDPGDNEDKGEKRCLSDMHQAFATSIERRPRAATGVNRGKTALCPTALLDPML